MALVKKQWAAKISIHALRVEGDRFLGAFATQEEGISIHALRVEGDYVIEYGGKDGRRFLSTPSGWRATSSSALSSPT